jgi:hypothetical protein
MDWVSRREWIFPISCSPIKCGMQVAPARGKSGLGWMRLLPDIPLVLSDLADGYLKLGEYWRSLKATVWNPFFPGRIRYHRLRSLYSCRTSSKRNTANKINRKLEAQLLVGSLRSLAENNSGPKNSIGSLLM